MAFSAGLEEAPDQDGKACLWEDLEQIRTLRDQLACPGKLERLAALGPPADVVQAALRVVRTAYAPPRSLDRETNSLVELAAVLLAVVVRVGNPIASFDLVPPLRSLFDRPGTG